MHLRTNWEKQKGPGWSDWKISQKNGFSGFTWRDTKQKKNEKEKKKEADLDLTLPFCFVIIKWILIITAQALSENISPVIWDPQITVQSTTGNKAKLTF